MLRLEKVKKYYRLHRHRIFGHEYLKAVDDVSFSVAKGESFGIVGESGCGKSTLAKTIVMLETPTAGNVYFEDQNLALLPRGEMRQVRRNIQIVFQDAYASLNPRFSISETLNEPLSNFAEAGKSDSIAMVNVTLDMVQLPKKVLACYPSELSGGERQRVCIARALILRPRLIVFDEATSGLDVTLQSQILKILAELRKELSLTYIFITHNLQILPYITDRVGVMFSGKMVELISAGKLGEAVHPYTKALIAAAPVQHPKDRRTGGGISLPSGTKSLTGGCCFLSRCPIARDACYCRQPEMAAAEHEGTAACFLTDSNP